MTDLVVGAIALWVGTGAGFATGFGATGGAGVAAAAVLVASALVVWVMVGIELVTGTDGVPGVVLVVWHAARKAPHNKKNPMTARVSSRWLDRRRITGLGRRIDILLCLRVADIIGIDWAV